MLGFKIKGGGKESEGVGKDPGVYDSGDPKS